MKLILTIFSILLAAMALAQGCAPSYTVTGSGNKITLTWAAAGDIPTPLDSIDYEGSMYSGATTGLDWKSDVYPNSTFTNIGPTTVTMGAYTCYYQDGVLVDALPVELIYFDVTAQNCHVMIHWATASELNNAYFSVERSADGEQWEEIKRINGMGNSNVTTIYHVEDHIDNPGVFYYRLVQVDYDGGSEEFSALAEICKSKAKIIKITDTMGRDVPEDYNGVKVVQYSNGKIKKKR